MKKLIAFIFVFSILFGSYILLFKFASESLFSYKILEPILVALGINSIIFVFFWKKKH